MRMKLGGANPHKYGLVIDRRWSVELVLDSLLDADALVTANRPPQTPFAELRKLGYESIGFSWTLIFEAEIAVLNGLRGQGAFPSGISVESSLWLAQPTGDILQYTGDLLPNWHTESPWV